MRIWIKALCWFVLAGTALLVVTTVRAEDKPAAAKQTPIAIAKTTQPIVVDGVLDEPAWKQAAEVHVNYIWGKVGTKADGPRMIVKYTWDDDYLYIGYETFDKNLVAKGSGDIEGPDDNKRQGCLISHKTEKVDVVEFFLSFGDERFFWELHHNASNQFNDVWITLVDDNWPIAKSTMVPYGIFFGFKEFMADDVSGEKTLAMKTQMKPKADGRPSSINDATDEDTGYTAELRLPWIGLGAPADRKTTKQIPSKTPPKDNPDEKITILGPWKMADAEMKILAVFQDGDLADHYHHVSPTFPGSWFHKGFAHWPSYVLKADAAK